MRQHKTFAQILLILSIFNLAFATPVVREIYDVREDVVVPVAVRNVAAISKEPRQPESDGSPSYSSPPLPPDGSAPSHSSPPLPDGSMPSDGPAPLHESPSPPGGPTGLAVSSPTSEIVPASDQPVRVHSRSTTQHDILASKSPQHDRESRLAARADIGHVVKWVAVGTAILAITIGVLWHNHNRHDFHRPMDGPDCSTAEGSHPCLDGH